jgi:DnaJ-domain-containing protein 1
VSSNEVWVAIVFGYIGYLIVSVFISAKTKNNSQDFQQNTSTHDTDDISSSWFHILDVPKTASFEIISSAYKRKISQYHPDKVSSLGSELRELAELKSKQINAAYNYAKKLRS